eukprot:CAMPEP_0198124908 /NCGR_PEP_ID=MMETSP1442-20131203/41263_1 /TAXON_ID= /ORGANISM="Craspedostauros australis, Strain CCMP3328" /LENGTH=30 /DNA_ID= /DNA_START= /DNA_END= /DNA_ORIENTATION=
MGIPLSGPDARTLLPSEVHQRRVNQINTNA